MLIGLLVLSVLAVIAPLGVRLLRRRFGYLAALVSLVLLVWYASLLPSISRGDERREVLSWLPTLGSAVALRLDGLALLFALLITGIGTLVALYTVGYLEDHPRLARFWVSLLLFQTAMLGIVLADDMIVLFVFWELTSVASFFLIGFAEERARARMSAQQAFLVTAVGGLGLLVGLLLLAKQTGSFRLSEILAQGPLPAGEILVTSAFILVLLGAATKSAQVPFHFWLPNAMEAPTPVSAYLHSATMVKAGVYLLARLSPVFSAHPWWEPSLVALGGLTALAGALLTVPQRDLKRLLAYSTVSALGLLILLLGLGERGAKAFTLFVLAHALYKGAAFLVAGAIEHATGQRTLDTLGDLRRVTPLLASTVAIVVLAAAGLPPSAGFVAKETILGVTLQQRLPPVVLLTSLALIGQTAAAWLVLRPLFGRRPAHLHAHELHWTLLACPILLGTTALVGGIVAPAFAPLVSAVTASVLGTTLPMYELAFWHGVTVELGVSMLIIVTAAALAVAWPRLIRLGDRLALTEPLADRPRGLGRIGFERLYHTGVAGIVRLGTQQTRLLQNGYLRIYITTIVVTALLLVGATVLRTPYLWPSSLPSWSLVDVVDILLVLIILVSSLAAVRATERLAAIAALGALGFCLALLYARFGAPDLAITQVLVDTLTVVLLVFAFYRLPRYARLSSTRARFRDAVLAAAFGAMMAAFALATQAFRYSERISAYFAEQAYPLAHGRNVVNVILVDFRALDTLGEITVLALAALGVAALLARRSRRREGSA